MNISKLTFTRKLFFSVITLYAIFTVSFIYYQYHRERLYKVELLNTVLVVLNNAIYEELDSPKEMNHLLSAYRKQEHLRNLRLSIIKSNGQLIYDNGINDINKTGNHKNREEVVKALKYGNGYAINRNSETLGQRYFYTATYFPQKDIVIRTALPYDTNLVFLLSVDKGYIWFSVILSAIMLVVFYNLTSRLGAMITELRRFAKRADMDEPINVDSMKRLGDRELEQISRHIIDIYERLRTTKDDLFTEREKLISHLQISNEGLAIFNTGKDVILTNGLFMQYINLISDTNIASAEEVFKVKELEPLFTFIYNTCEKETISGFKQKPIVIDKNGYIFNVSVVLFADKSFEISISDITKQEEQARMKQQLTQNIAHELKTPVSSIHGYLETILNNPDLSPDVLKRFLERSFAQSNRLSNLLRDINALSRMTDAAEMIDISEVNVSEMIHNIAEELALNFEERRMNLLLNIPDHMVIEGNFSLLYSIFRNLMDNAIAYAGDGTELRVVCYSEDDEYYYFTVADNGVGVSQEHLGRLFERFYRVDKGRSRKIGGTGLGLAIVKNAVIFHGGNIHAKQASNGSGLEFLFSLKKNKQ